MTPQDFTAWTVHMKTAWGWSDRECSRRLGCGTNSIATWRQHGAPLYIALACSALANSVPAWSQQKGENRDDH